MGSPRYHLAYVFERFPSFVQTFCVREILELERLGLRPYIFSLRDIRQEAEKYFPPELIDRVHFLPEEEELKKIIKPLVEEKEHYGFSKKVIRQFRHWGKRLDKIRIYEAAYIGLEMKKWKLKHVHTHFAGIGARTAWWLKQFFGHSYSFTGHANDLFCQTEYDLNLKALIEAASFVVSVSDFSVKELKEKFPQSQEKIYRVYNGLDFHSFQAISESLKPTPHKPLIFTVGRLTEKKGFDDLIRSCRFLLDKGMIFDCMIAGEGELREELEKLIQDLNMDSHVHLVGAKSQEEIKDYLRRTTVFALPCVTEKDGGKDNLPTVLMEAMAVGLPCVSTRLAGIPEMVIEGQTGFLTEERNPKEFAEGIEKILRNPELAHRFGQAGQELAQNKFSQDKTAFQLMCLLLSQGKLRFDKQLYRSHASFAQAYWQQWKKTLTWQRD